MQDVYLKCFFRSMLYFFLGYLSMFLCIEIQTLVVTMTSIKPELKNHLKMPKMKQTLSNGLQIYVNEFDYARRILQNV